MEPEILHGEFDTLLLDNSSGQEGEHEECPSSVFDNKDHLVEFLTVFSFFLQLSFSVLNF